MNYNENYISIFDTSVYEMLLASPKDLLTLRDAWLNKNNINVKIEVNDILKKESLDHYVLKKLMNDPEFLESPKMANYINHIFDICRIDSLELLTNKVFQNPEIRNKIMNKYSPSTVNVINDNINKMYDRLNHILERMEKRENISQKSLDYVASFFGNSRRVNEKEYEIFLKYVFNELPKNNLKFNTVVQNAVLTYLPKFYNQGVNDVRYILGDTDNGKDIKGPGHSSSVNNYVAMNKDYFKNVNMNSYDDSKVERLKDGSDFSFFMVVSLHEITHQVQRKACTKKYFDNQGMQCIIRNLLNEEYHDYKDNHDSDEIEIDANFNGWKQSEKFFAQFCDKDKYPELTGNCYMNQNAADARRLFSYKEDKDGNKQPYADYDIERLVEIVKRKPEVLKRYPMLLTFFNEKGQIKTSFMFNNSLYTYSTGREFINYFYKHGGIDAMLKRMEHTKLSYDQCMTLVNNLYYVLKDQFKRSSDLSYVVDRKIQGEYKKSEKLDEIVVKRLSIECFKDGISNYSNVLALFHKLAMQDPKVAAAIKQTINYINLQEINASEELGLQNQMYLINPDTMKQDNSISAKK